MTSARQAQRLPPPQEIPRDKITTTAGRAWELLVSPERISANLPAHANR